MRAAKWAAVERAWGRCQPGAVNVLATLHSAGKAGEST
jgi:hypothetical protein